MNMGTPFHLSLGVNSLEDSVNFFVDILEAKIEHRDPSGYVNIDFFGNQITLKQNSSIKPNLPDFHFGVNLSLSEFQRLSEKVLENGMRFVTVKPETWDAGTPMERTKMYLKCPTGYLVEIKGYA